MRDLIPATTERLIVRRMRETDLSDLLAYQTHPEVLRYTPVEPMTPERARRYLQGQADEEIGDEGGWRAFAVERRDDGRMIGEVGVFLSPRAQSKGDVGWTIHPSCHGMGYATEAAAVLLSYAFAVRGLHRVTAACDTRNVASFRLMKRLGMRREGHLLQSRFADGAWHDEFLYALLQSEWRARNAPPSPARGSAAPRICPPPGVLSQPQPRSA